ncbi:MAG: DUF1573 domain-containing protein [Bacteroidaceae bacterium]|nr:DUF1573 domain-containing protein [Bacteroidaceae bacterium]
MTKKFAVWNVALFCSLAISAQTDIDKKGPVISFAETDFNFGSFSQENGVQSHYFVFTNTGDEVLMLTEVYGSCNCTVPEYPKTPVAPGDSDSIKVTYNGKSLRPGIFHKFVTVNYNASKPDDSMVRLKIIGEMVDNKVYEQMSSKKKPADTK